MWRTNSTLIRKFFQTIFVSLSRNLELLCPFKLISDGKRYLGIWLYRLHPLTVVWIANREAPVLDDVDHFA
ncbi:hypothetical protein Bca4012_019641 [Brassica carinata]